MRKMFSKKQVEDLAVNSVNAGISSGDIRVGTKLYSHYIYFNNNEDLWIELISNHSDLEFTDSISSNLQKIVDAFISFSVANAGDSDVSSYKILNISLEELNELTITGIVNGAIYQDGFDHLEITSISEDTVTPL